MNEIKSISGEVLKKVDADTLRAANLRFADLHCADLRAADLCGAYLRSADLRGADLRAAYLRCADLRFADLRSADLRGAYMRCADLRSANLHCANLRGVYMRCADLRGTNLTDITVSWQSHQLISEILYRAAGDDLQKQAFAGFVRIKTGWCWDWDQFLSMENNLKGWAIAELKKWVKPGDGAPEILRP